MVFSQFLDTIQSGKVMIVFHGPFHQETLVSLGDVIRDQIRVSRIAKSVFAIFVELSQNVLKHSVSRRNNERGDKGVGILMLREEDGVYEISSGNYIPSGNAKEFRQVLERVHGMDSAQLRAAFREKRREPLPTQAKGAGLGIMEIAKYADHPLEFDFLPLGEHMVLFSLTARVDKSSGELRKTDTIAL